jgi:hypothetical protein
MPGAVFWGCVPVDPHPWLGSGVQPPAGVSRRLVTFVGTDKGLAGKRFLSATTATKVPSNSAKRL